MDVVASGISLPPDPLRIILKRIILTGYPLRCHKKKATIRFMFFDPKDIKYFRPVELYSQDGLRVSIIVYDYLMFYFNNRDILKTR